MIQPLWKKWLSYLWPLQIEAVEGVHNPYLEILYYKGRYQLNTENAIYSFEDLYTNYYRAFEKVELEKLEVNNVLILGLGLGSIPVMLERNFKVNYHFTGVEIDEEVIHLAHKYALNGLKSPIEIVCTDAYNYVAQCHQKFEMICVDIFIDDVIPHEFEQQDFLNQVKDLLTDNGMLFYNRLGFTDNDKKNNLKFYNKQFKPIFPKGRYLDLDDNWMFLNK